MHVPHLGHISSPWQVRAQGMLKNPSMFPSQEEMVSWITRLTEGLPGCSNPQFTLGKVSAVTWRDADHHWLKEAGAPPSSPQRGRGTTPRTFEINSCSFMVPGRSRSSIGATPLVSGLSVTQKSLLSFIQCDFHHSKFTWLVITAILNMTQSKHVVSQKVTGE